MENIIDDKSRKIYMLYYMIVSILEKVVALYGMMSENKLDLGIESNLVHCIGILNKMKKTVKEVKDNVTTNAKN